MGSLVSSLFSFGTHDDTLSFRVWESIVQYRHDISQEPHTPLDHLLDYFPQDSLMSSCNFIFMSFAYLIEPYAGFPNFEYQPYSPSLSHVQPHRAILYILCSLIPNFYREGTFPQVSLSYTYVLALSIGMFHYLELVYFPIDTHILLVCNYKALLFFFKLFKIFEKVQKIFKKKPKSRTRKDVIFGSSRVMSPSNKALYITSIGWVVRMALGVVLIHPSFLQ